MANAYNILHVARTISERLDLIEPILYLYFYCHKTHKRKKTIGYNKKKTVTCFISKSNNKLELGSLDNIFVILYIRVLCIGDCW